MEPDAIAAAGKRRPSVENLSASIRYFPPEGRLGSIFTARIEGSSDATKDFVLFRAEVWVEFTSPPSFQGGDLRVSAEFETNAAKLQLLDYEDEYGTSDLKVEWKVEPYATTGYRKDQRTHDQELASGFEVPHLISQQPIFRSRRRYGTSPPERHSRSDSLCGWHRSHPRGHEQRLHIHS